MPPPPGSSGEARKKRKGRAPKHMNSYAFRHNLKSKKTDKILASANVGVCRRCSDKIEWRKKYRKYKPRSQPGKCNLCSQKNVLAAYHTICGKCATSDKAIIAMEKRTGSSSTTTAAALATPASALAALTLENSETPSSSNKPGDDDAKRGTDDTPSTPTAADHDDTTLSVTAGHAKRRVTRICAICANEPTLSRYATAGVDGDIVVTIQELEETLEAGRRPGDERRLTLRERKAAERRIEKLELELRQRKTRRNNGEEVIEREEGEEGDEGARDSDSGVEEERDRDDAVGVDSESLPGARVEPTEDDSFLAATGGKALVGEEYQQMLLAREQQQ